MPSYQLEQVFNEAAFPELTFVPPKEYPHIRSAFRTEGKHVTISGPSGSGKTTLVRHLFRDLGVADSQLLSLNARRYSEAESGIQLLAEEVGCEPTYDALTPYLKSVTFVLIDDFHRLTQSARLEIARTLKLWHENGVRFLIVGIASSAEELYGVDPELGIRNDPFELKQQDVAFTRDLIQKGEAALNIRFSDSLRDQIEKASNGVPSAIQVICKACCIEARVEATVEGAAKQIEFNLRDLRESVLRIFHAKYMDKVVGMAKGKRQARSVHNTYFDIIAAIAESGMSEIPVEWLYRRIVASLPDREQQKRKATSFYNCLKNFSEVVEEQGLSDTIVHAKGAKTISIEDPTFRFYLNLLDINDIRSRVDLRSDEYPYDVAVSFAGDICPIVERFVRALQEHGITVFYDFDQQAQLWGQDLRQRLAQVYANEALFMVVFLSRSYPERDWPEFEAHVGKDAAKKRTQEYLLPVVLDDTKIVGIHDTVAFVDLRAKTPEEAAHLLVEKIQASASARPDGA